MKFIRKNGRVIPISDGDSGSSGKPAQSKHVKTINKIAAKNRKSGKTSMKDYAKFKAASNALEWKGK